MDLPPSLAAIGEQLAASGDIVTDAQWLESAEVFAAERERIFARPWIAVDHVSRLASEHCYFRFDSGGRSFLMTRAQGGSLYALRNVCIHAGYPVCDAEEGPAQRLICPYHGWEFTADGRLVEPNLSARIDPARLRLGSYPVAVRGGLIFVDLSGRAEPPKPNGAALPDWLGSASVVQRARWGSDWNWKSMLQFLRSVPLPVFDGWAEPGSWRSFGPLSLVLVEDRRTALLRVIPKSAGQTDLQLIELAGPDAPPSAATPQAVAELLQEARPGPLDREFFAWYWPLLSPVERADSAAKAV